MHRKVVRQAWLSADLRNSSRWIADAKDIATIRDRVLDELENGLGLFLIRGFPIQRLPIDEIKGLLLELGLRLGSPLPQNPSGVLVSDIRATTENRREQLKGKSYETRSDATGTHRRFTETNYTGTQAAFDFHSDPCDVAALLCVSNASRGGESRVVSAIALHDALVEAAPKLLETLYRDFYYLKLPDPRVSLDEQRTDFHRIPVFSIHEGNFKSHFVPEFIRGSQGCPELPRLSALQMEAVDRLMRMANDKVYYHEFAMRPGDLSLVNNHVVLHSRTSFEDTADQARHLLRLWLAVPNSRPLPPIHGAWFGDVRPGARRGGYRHPLVERR